MQHKFRMMEIKNYQICKRTSQISWILFFTETFLFSCNQVQEQSKIKKQASNGSVLPFPKAMKTFNPILKTKITENTTPNLYMIMRRTLADAGLSTYAAKNYYKRERPFMMNNAPICTPVDEVGLRSDGSYPLGHTAIGWAWALILKEIFPTQTDAILIRGKEFGISRNVCNVHWHSDVLAGRMMCTAAVAALHANTYFLIDLEAAKTEILKLKESVNN